MRTWRGILAALLCLVLAPAAWAAEAGRAIGTVVDSERQPLPGMTVRATDVVDPARTFTAVTDGLGRFTVADLPAGSYLVAAETVNTRWLQKDDSPIVEVSPSATPDVTLVLVQAAELKAAGGDGGSNALQFATLGTAALATGAAVAALVETNDLEDDNEELQRQNRDLSDQIDDLNEDLTRQIDDLEAQLRRLERDLAALGGQNEELQRQIAELQRQIEELKELVDQRTASPTR